ncbi:MAG TPA: glycosyltransferase [Solirubrobacteraceae bacterium]|nr:glycosyltransferase [Solirubrobacteraceae bacterium]
MRARPARRPRVLADGWYGWLVPGFRSVTDVYARWPWVQASTLRVGALRALLVFATSVRYDAVVMIRTDRGWRSLLLLRALLGRRRKLVALHFIDHPDRVGGRGAVFDRLWRRVDRWATRRAVLAAQVLSQWEVERYGAGFGVPRFRYVPFAWRMAGPGAPEPDGLHARDLVVASGRAFCDWPTVFAAAQGAQWRLLVVCGGHDRAVVDGLNADGRTEVVCDVSPSRARELLRGAAVSVLPMYEAGVSQGHVRLCDAIDAGAVIVASRTRSLEGYVADGVSAVLVAPGDAGALRAAVDRLLGDPAERERLARAAFARAAAWTWDDYLAAIEAFARGAAARGSGSTA